MFLVGSAGWLSPTLCFKHTFYAKHCPRHFIFNPRDSTGLKGRQTENTRTPKVIHILTKLIIETQINSESSKHGTLVKSVNTFSFIEIGIITSSVSLVLLRTVNNLPNFYNFWAKAKVSGSLSMSEVFAFCVQPMFRNTMNLTKDEICMSSIASWITN